MKRYINQETVMLASLCLVVLVILFGATIAWYIGFDPVGIRNFALETDDLGDLYVYVKVEEGNNISSAGNIASDGNVLEDEDENNANSENIASSGDIDEEGYVRLSAVGTGDDINYTIDLNITELENIEEHTLAPGAYGKVQFKILSKSNNTTGYKLMITPIVEAIDNLSSITTNITEDELEELAKSHIKFYATLDNGEYSDVILYSDECMNEYILSSEDVSWIDNEDGIKGNVVKDEVQYLTLYWYWPYEFVDIPQCLDITNENSRFYSEFRKYLYIDTVDGEDNPVEIPRTTAESIEAYDWDDTYIGNFTKKLAFHFDVKEIKTYN